MFDDPVFSKSQSFTSDGCPSESPLGHETDNVESPVSCCFFLRLKLLMPFYNCFLIFR